MELNYEITKDKDRCAAVKEILNNASYTPTERDLEKMANYIIYGRDENDKNIYQRKEAIDIDNKKKTWRRRDEKNESLDKLLENPIFTESSATDISNLGGRNTYIIPKPSIDREKDKDIPGMQQLWDSIARMERTLYVGEGLIEPAPGESRITSPKKLFFLRREIIASRRDQYILRDIFKPQVQPRIPLHSSQQTYDWDSDSFYYVNGEKHIVREHKFDFENPEHIRLLAKFYSDIYMQLWDDPFSSGRCLLSDYNMYFDKCNFSPLREYIITRHIDGATFMEIRDEINEKFDVRYNLNTIARIINKEIPETIAAFVKKERLLDETPSNERQLCRHCNRCLPLSILFYNHNYRRKNTYDYICKDCRREMRVKNGGQASNDKRFKDKNMSQVQTK